MIEIIKAWIQRRRKKKQATKEQQAAGVPVRELVFKYGRDGEGISW